MTTKTQATVEDPYQVEGKAELVDGEIVLISDPENSIIFRRGDLADAGEAVPGWSMPARELFPQDE